MIESQTSQTGEMEIPVSVLVVDDQPLVLDAVQKCIASEPDLRVIGRAADGAQALLMAGDLHPRVVLMDLQMPSMNGIEATVILKQRIQDVRVVIFSIYDDRVTQESVSAAGADAFVSKHDNPDILLAAIREVGLRH